MELTLGRRAEGGGRAKSGEVVGGGRRAEGGHWADHEGLWRRERSFYFVLVPPTIIRVW